MAPPSTIYRRAVTALAASAAATRTWFYDIPAEYPQDGSVLYLNWKNSAVITGAFNRTTFQEPWMTSTTDKIAEGAFAKLNSSSFIAYEKEFFDVIGTKASIKQLATVNHNVHEAATYIESTGKIFWTEWGMKGGEHLNQLIYDIKTGVLSNLTTSPPIQNVHGSMIQNGNIYAVTDGGNGTYAGLFRINATTFKSELILNNYLGHPFNGFNDIQIDNGGNFWLTDSLSAWSWEVIDTWPGLPPTVYFVNATTMEVRPVDVSLENSNGLTISPDGKTLYLIDSGASNGRPNVKNLQGSRGIYAYDILPGPILSNRRLFNLPVAGQYDGMRVTKSGYILAASAEGIDVLSPLSGKTLGTIHLGAGLGGVNLAFAPNGTTYVVGKGAIWAVEIKEQGIVRH